jgi:hypothetical protein
MHVPMCVCVCVCVCVYMCFFRRVSVLLSAPVHVYTKMGGRGTHAAGVRSMWVRVSARMCRSTAAPPARPGRAQALRAPSRPFLSAHASRHMPASPPPTASPPRTCDARARTHTHRAQPRAPTCTLVYRGAPATNTLAPPGGTFYGSSGMPASSGKPKARFMFCRHCTT